MLGTEVGCAWDLDFTWHAGGHAWVCVLGFVSVHGSSFCECKAKVTGKDKLGFAGDGEPFAPFFSSFRLLRSIGRSRIKTTVLAKPKPYVHKCKKTG